MDEAELYMTSTMPFESKYQNNGYDEYHLMINFQTLSICDAFNGDKFIKF